MNSWFSSMKRCQILLEITLYIAPTLPTSINSLSPVPLVPPLAHFPAIDPAVKPAPYTPAACPSLALSPTTPIPFTPMIPAPPETSSTCTQCDSFYVGETINSLSTRMNGHRSSSNRPDDLPLPVAIHTRSHHLPFNSCWNVRVLHNLPPTLTKSLAAILNLHTNSFYLLDSVLALISDNFPPSIPLATPWWHLS